MSNRLEQIVNKALHSTGYRRRRKYAVSAISIAVAAITLMVMILPAVATTGIVDGDVRMEQNSSEADNITPAAEEIPPEEQVSEPSEENSSDGADAGSEDSVQQEEPVVADGEVLAEAPETIPDSADTSTGEAASSDANTPAVPESGAAADPENSTEGSLDAGSAQTVEAAEDTGTDGEPEGQEELTADEETAIEEETEAKEKPAVPDAAAETKKEVAYLSELTGEDEYHGVRAKVSFDGEYHIEEGASLSVRFVMRGDGDPEMDASDPEKRIYLPAQALASGAQNAVAEELETDAESNPIRISLHGRLLRRKACLLLS